MNRILAFVLAMAIAPAHADDRKADQKKSAKAKKSEKNPFDKAAGDVESWAKRTFTRKEEKKK